jgi:hypothetical protein
VSDPDVRHQRDRQRDEKQRRDDREQRIEERTLSKKLRDAGFTRRPSWRSLPKDGDDE